MKPSARCSSTTVVSSAIRSSISWHGDCACPAMVSSRLPRQAHPWPGRAAPYRRAALPSRPANQAPLKVFVYDSGEDKPFTSGRNGMPTAIIEAAGGRNVMASLRASWTTTSWESVAAAEPDVIILLDYQTGAGADSLRRFLESHPLMKLTPAVSQSRYLKLQYSELKTQWLHHHTKRIRIRLSKRL